MGLRLRKSFKICPGVKLNFGLGGLGLSVGGKGLRYSVHSSGRRTSSIGIPGTGVSYVSTSTGRKRRISAAALEKQMLKEQEAQFNKTLVEEYQDTIESIKSIHTTCDETINWENISISSPPYDKVSLGPQEAIATKNFENYKPSLWERIFSSKLERKKLLLQDRITKARDEDKTEYESWQSIVEVSKKILEQDIDIYLAVIAEMNPLDDLLEFGSEFEFGIDHAEEIEVEFRVRSDVVVPSFALSLTSSGKLSRKNLTKTAYFDLVQDYVCSCSMRIARDMFAILPIKNVVVHAVDNVLNTTTGHNEDITILSVRFEREKLNNLNFDTIDPSDSMANFKHYMKFQKTTGFKKVDRLTEK